MRICLAAQIFAPQDEGGAEISARLAAEALARRHRVTVLSLGQPGAPSAPVGEIPLDAPYRLRRLRFRNAYLPAARRAGASLAGKLVWHLRCALGALDPAELRAVLREEAPDVLYANNCTYMQPTLFRVAHALGIPIVMHARDYGTVCPRASMYRGGANCARVCADCRLLGTPARRSTALVDHAIAISAFQRDRLQAGGAMAAARWHVLHNTNMPRQPRPPREGRAGAPFTLGYLGAVTPEKGVDALLAAVQAIAMPGLRLLIGGRADGGFAAALRARSAGDDRIAWLGFVEPGEVIARADLMVVPSLWHEPLGRVPIEAANAGVPVLAARRGGLPETVEGYRIGWTYDPDTPGALYAQLSWAAGHGTAGWAQTVSERFPGLAGFDGSAEGTAYYERLEAILEAGSRGCSA